MPGKVDDGMTTPQASQERATEQHNGHSVANAVPLMVDEQIQTVEVVPMRDRVRWGPVWAGLLAGVAIFLILELLAYAIGLLTTPASGGGLGASDASPWITGILSLVGFFVGGYVAERSAAERGVGAGLLNGFMVWALGTGFILAFSVLGVGVLGNAIGQVLVSGGQLTAPSSATAAHVAQLTQGVALSAFVWLVIAAIVAAIGGLVGSIGRSQEYLLARLPARVKDA